MSFTPRDLVVYVDARPESWGRLEFAAALATPWGAHLTAVLVPRELGEAGCEGFAVGPVAIRSLLDHYRSRIEEANQAIRERLQEISRRNHIVTELRIAAAESGERLMLHARYADLAIVGCSQGWEQPTREVDLAEQVVLASGRPALVLPRRWSAGIVGRRIVVGWNGSREAARAVGDALPLLAGAETVDVVTVLEEKTQEERKKDGAGADIVSYLKRAGANPRLNEVEGEAADAADLLAGHAREIGADLLVCGAYSRSRIPEIVFGGVTRSFLREPPMPVLLSQ